MTTNMIPAEQLELITAAVDGELSATQARAFRRLMDGSPEARALYLKLKGDSDRVTALPQATPPVDLRAKILARVAALTPKPVAKPKAQPAQTAQPAHTAQPESVPLRHRMPLWVPVAAAACLLVGVTAVSFAYFNSQNPSSNLANSLPVQHEAPLAVPSATASAPQDIVRPDPNAVVKNPIAPVPPPSVPMPKEIEPGTLTQVAPEPRAVQHDLHASPTIGQIKPFDLIKVRVPFLRTVADLEREDIQKELHDELAREANTPFRLDLFVRDPARGAEVMQNAAKAAGLTLFADATTLERVKKKQVSSIVIYTESLSAKEIADLFEKVSAEDAKFSPRVCDSLHASPMRTADAETLKTVFGNFDVGVFKRPNGTGSGGTGQGTKSDRTPEPKPISSDTIDSVVKSVTTPKPEKTALLMTWLPEPARTAPLGSAELKAFLTKRTDRKPNAVPTIIVIRPIG